MFVFQDTDLVNLTRILSFGTLSPTEHSTSSTIPFTDALIICCK